MLTVGIGAGGARERSGHLRASRRHLLGRTLAASLSLRELLPTTIPDRGAIIALGCVVDEPRSALPRRRLSSWTKGWPSGSADGAVLRAGYIFLTSQGAGMNVKAKEHMRRQGMARTLQLGEEAVAPRWSLPRAPTAKFEGGEARLGRASGAPEAREKPRVSARAAKLEGP